MTRLQKTLLALGVAVGGIALATTPPRLNYMPEVRLDPDLPSLLQDSEGGLIPGTEKRLTWHDGEQATQWSVVALHGFSASRQETAPLAEIVADSIGANLFETRFAGHGLKENGLSDVTAEEWLDDVADALTVGQLIGDKLVVIATSNGAALTMAMLEHPAMQTVDAVVMLSPNFAPADSKAKWLTRPGGPLLLRLIMGPTRSWKALNDRQELYWTTSYPSETTIQVMRVVNRANKTLRESRAPRVQVVYSPNDIVISLAALQSAYAAIQSPLKEIFEVAETGSPFNHIIVGDIISPNNTIPVAAKITEFILRQNL
jgi:esterase/lipase